MLAHRLARAVSTRAADRLWRWLARHRAVGTEDHLARRYAAFGAGALIAFPPGDVVGEEHIAIGAATIVAPGVSMAVGMIAGQTLPPGATSPVLRIGARCSIGRGSHLVAHRSIVIGDDVMTGPYCYVTDHDHAYADPAVPVGRQWPADAAVEIGDGSWLGHGVVVLAGTRLGRNTVVAAGAVVRGTHPDHAVLAGIPARVVRRLDPEHGWDPPLRATPGAAPDGWPR